MIRGYFFLIELLFLDESCCYIDTIGFCLTMPFVSRIAELEKKIKELNDQIRVFKNELSDKQKEFQQEKADLQSVIDQLKQGGDQVP